VTDKGVWLRVKPITNESATGAVLHAQTYGMSRRTTRCSGPELAVLAPAAERAR
jgi:hypothetical protein